MKRRTVLILVSRGSSGSSLLLHTSRLLHASFWLSPFVLSFFPDASAEIDEDDEDDEGEQCNSSIEL